MPLDGPSGGSQSRDPGPNHDNGPLEDMAEYRRDPPPPLPANPAALARDDEDPALHAWLSRNRAYLRSPECTSMHQLPTMARLWGYDQSWFRGKIIAELVFITRAAGRRLTPDEMDLYLFYVSRFTVAQSYDRPAAILTTAYLIRRGWTEYTFPFYQPTFGRFNPNAFPSTARAFLRGRAAAGMWQLVRCGLYGGLGLSAYVFLGPRYCTYMDETQTILEMEPGLEQLGNDIMEHNEARSY